MGTLRLRAVLTAIVCVPLLSLLTPSSARAAETQGLAILEHACGKVSVQQMALVHAGRMEESLKLGTPELQAEWKAMPADDKKMMSGMMQEMSQSEADYRAAIEADGLLVVDGAAATLTVTKELEDENGTSTETTTQKFVIDAKGCWISR